ncbi:MAG: AAA family ATPase [Eubacteriales bacterium]|nr:AAA family ATPase [Eubacteriales bacterium]
MRKIPIGIQGFEKLRTEKFLYVDKTEYIYRLVRNGGQYFLSRPRRFGKSLFVSSLKAYWEGKKDLFQGCRIAVLEEDNSDAWTKYPVFLFDFSGKNYQQKGALEEILDEQMRRWEKEYKILASAGSLEERFRNILLAAFEQTGRRSVILADEYDKSLLETMDHPALEEHNKAVFKGFFSSLKGYDEYIQFVFITGVTKFEKVSIFSDLNQLNDISLMEDFSGCCGITEKELLVNFMPEIEELAGRQGISVDECLRMLRNKYDGYRFHYTGESVYNPFSLLKSFYDKDFGSYWFETGTPTFLVKKLRSSGLDVRKLADRTLYVNETSLSDYRADNPDPVPLMFQTGYLTIAGYEPKRRRYTLGFPNEEVKYGMLESLMPAYSSDVAYGTDIYTLDEYVESGDLEGIRSVFTALFAGIPYTEDRNPFEHYFQTVVYLVFTLLGRFVLCEMHTFSGRIDCKVETGDYIYLFEFKRDDTAESALNQIDEMQYALPFAADSRKVFKIGVTFDSQKRILDGWKVSE